ncbi:GlsB/YeaQ/YmgE family stress response membrane protein [Candidatus Saccharibacteria bacterium]|nr:GlsB/YeaQ/YmgE family stress response membrane protein [Candidatus Saccharibacteria bacterium]
MSTFWEIVGWIVLGALAGWIASMITGTNARINGWMNVAVGIVGAFIGGLVLRLFGVSTSGVSLASLLTAILGAVVLLAIVRAMRSNPV